MGLIQVNMLLRLPLKRAKWKGLILTNPLRQCKPTTDVMVWFAPIPA